ncbi:unnamed protein product [Colias eurytheme]|nr:unnamed protein product [Colias eurytheme]
MARAPEPQEDKFAGLAGIAESLSLLGLSPETLAMSLGESLAERYLAALRPKPEPPQPALQLFSNDFIDYLNQLA